MIKNAEIKVFSHSKGFLYTMNYKNTSECFLQNELNLVRKLLNDCNCYAALIY